LWVHGGGRYASLDQFVKESDPDELTNEVKDAVFWPEAALIRVELACLLAKENSAFNSCWILPRTKNEEPLHVALNQSAINALRRVRAMGIGQEGFFEGRERENRCEVPVCGLIEF
jgi:hypothetical protein